MADSRIAEVMRRLLLAALCWAAVAGWAGRAAPAFGDITFFIGSDLHYGYTQHTPTCDEISRATLDRMNLLPGQSYPAVAGGGLAGPTARLVPAASAPAATRTPSKPIKSFRTASN